MCDHTPNREAAMLPILPTGFCDPCIHPLVQALNDAGFRTKASCCGHGRHPTRIALADGRDLLIMSFDEANRIGGLWPGINGEPPTLEVVAL